MSFRVQQQQEHGDQGDPNLPTYTATDEESLLTRIAQVPGVVLPILRTPTPEPARYAHPEWTDDEYHQRQEQHRLQVDIVSSFFDAIERGIDDVVQRFISTGLVCPDTTNGTGETPLLAAVRVGNSAMVRKLVSLGAIVDGYGRTQQEPGTRRRDLFIFPERTALQLAAQTGNLAIVKILMQEFGADDSLIAPDGALALRLAAANGHREIVDYLPVRRGGAWKRWRYAHQIEMNRIKRAFRKIGQFLAFFLWKVPRFFLWTLPKETTQAAAKNLKSAWKRRREFGGWVKRQVSELPSRAYRAGKKVAKVVKKIPGITKRLLARIWESIKALPKAFKMCAEWIGGILAKTGHWIAHVFNRIASFIHTVLAAVVSWFRRTTLKDVWNGFCSALDAVFVGFPTLLWSFAKSFAKFTYKTFEVVFGTLGLCVWYIGVGILWLIGYIPRKLWQSLEAFGRIIAKAVDEILVYFNPKKV